MASSCMTGMCCSVIGHLSRLPQPSGITGHRELLQLCYYLGIGIDGFDVCDGFDRFDEGTYSF